MVNGETGQQSNAQKVVKEDKDTKYESVFLQLRNMEDCTVRVLENWKQMLHATIKVVMVKMLINIKYVLFPHLILKL